MDKLEHYIAHPEELNTETLEELKIIVEKHPYFQAAKMLYLRNLKETSHPEFEAELKKLSIGITNRKKLYYFLNPKSKAQSSNEYFSNDLVDEDRRNEVDDLIENFIRKKPSLRFNTENKADISSKDFSEDSVSENEEIITETFANLLVEQKQYEKAIEAFNKLSLKNPEKSVYFAGRIEEIRTLMNN